MSEFSKTERNQVRRVAKRGKYDRETINAILDEGYLCHVGFSVGEQPFVIPTLYARIDDSIIIHGSSISRMLKNIEEGVRVCVTVTLVDGLVLARSAFHHSMNYRSVVVHGWLRRITEPEEKEAALIAVTDHILPGRWDEVRPMTDKEFKSTGVLAIDIEAASAKIRSGPPVDEDEDYALPVWAGVLPTPLTFGEPIPDAKLDAGMEPPASIEAAVIKFSISSA